MANIIVSAFRAKFVHVGLNDVHSPKDLFLVARQRPGGTIGGICELFTPNLAAPVSGQDDGHMRQFATALGRWGRPRAGKLRMVMSGNEEKELVPGETYITVIGVYTDLQSQGLESIVLDRGDAVAASYGYCKVSLHVTGNNV